MKIRARLTDDEVREIADLIERGWKHADIARMFCVDQSTITRIATGESHADVLADQERTGPCRCHKCLVYERQELNLDLADRAESPRVCVHCGRRCTSARSVWTRRARGHVVCDICRKKGVKS